MTLFRHLLLFLIISLFIIPAFSDTIHLKNGRTIEGVVRESEGDEILIQTAGGLFSFKRDAIDRIEKSSELSNLLSQARVEDMRGDHKQAISTYLEAQNLAKTPDEKRTISTQLENTIQKYIKNVQTHDPFTQGLADIKEIEALKRKISNPHLLSLLQSCKMKLDNDVVEAYHDEAVRKEHGGEYKLAIEYYNVIRENYPDHPRSRNLDEKTASLYMEYGDREFKRGQSYWENAEEALQQVIQDNPSHSRALFILGQIAMRLDNNDRAKQYFSKVDPSQLSAVDANNLQKFKTRIQAAMQTQNTEVKKPDYVPRIQPQEEPVESKSTTENVGGWLSRTWRSIKGFFVGIWQGSGNTINTAMGLLWYAAIALGVLIVYWYIPMKIVTSDLPNRKVVYYNWRKIINLTGVFGLLFYFIDRWRREEPRKRCPACNRAIDSHELYENYEFDHCPFCETQIKPVFTMSSIIQNEAHSIAQLRARNNSTGADDVQREMMQRLINMIMIHGRKIRASDIHIEPEERSLLVRYRVDGVLTESVPVSESLQNFLVSCVKVLCNLDIAERRLPQDGHFRRVLMGEEINVRASTIPTRLGEKLVLRLLDQKTATSTVDSLGMRDTLLVNYQRAIKSPHGLILATGPTGSGKTTLQYASLQYINDGSKNIITVEDPIEYELDGINQIQHNTATGLTFATALRSILRQDPDVIMVGEIRDLETATISVNAALTGHLVFSTLHTIDTSTALSRLIDIGVDVKMLSSALTMIVAQRLVRKLCPHCKKASSASSRELKMFGKDGRIMEGQTVYRARGCKECSNTGYIGRTGIYEVLIPGKEVRNKIEEGAHTMQLREASMQAGMKTLREEGALKILSGITSIEEVIRVTTDDAFGEFDDGEGDSSDNLISLEGSG